MWILVLRLIISDTKFFWKVAEHLSEFWLWVYFILYTRRLVTMKPRYLNLFVHLYLALFLISYHMPITFSRFLPTNLAEMNAVLIFKKNVIEKPHYRYP